MSLRMTWLSALSLVGLSYYDLIPNDMGKFDESIFVLLTGLLLMNHWHSISRFISLQSKPFRVHLITPDFVGRLNHISPFSFPSQAVLACAP